MMDDLKKAISQKEQAIEEKRNELANNVKATQSKIAKIMGSPWGLVGAFTIGLIAPFLLAKKKHSLEQGPDKPAPSPAPTLGKISQLLSTAMFIASTYRSVDNMLSMLHHHQEGSKVKQPKRKSR